MLGTSTAAQTRSPEIQSWARAAEFRSRQSTE
jgi:hypothetical protein